MDPQNKANLLDLLVELRATRKRLTDISDASFGDMEGADMPDFAIAQEIYHNCERAAYHLSQCIEGCEHHAQS